MVEVVAVHTVEAVAAAAVAPVGESGRRDGNSLMVIR